MRLTTLLTSVILVISSYTNAQTYGYSVDVKISGRIDTTTLEVKQIYRLFKNYIESRPDSIYDNPYWNIQEKKLDLLGNPALFYKPFYNLGMSPSEIFNYWKPFIMSIEKRGVDKYRLRVAFMKESDEPDKIITIIWLNAVKENNKWVLQNTLSDIETSWNYKHYNKIKYVFPHTYQFNDSLAQKASDFCDSITNQLGITYLDTCTFYICDNPDDMGLLLGYDFFYLSYTTGITNKWLKQVFSAKGNEYYPHELIHILLGVKNENRSYVIEEGLACFLGEYKTDKYNRQINSLAKDYLAMRPSYTLDNLLMNKVEYSGYQAEYATGSVLAEIVYSHAGYKGIRALSDANTSSLNDIYRCIQDITGLNKKQLEHAFKNRIKQYLN